MSELQLDTLESKGLIRLATIDPELEYLFRHALLQDAAYESLLKQERRVLHRQVGEALEQLYPERRGELAAMLARHFEQAGDSERAIEYLVAAAQYATERNALTEAYDLYERARALLPPADDADPPELRRRRLEIDFGQVKSGFALLPEKEQLQRLEPLIDQAKQLGDLRLEADIRVHTALIRMFNGEQPTASPGLDAHLARVDEIAAELNDPILDALPKSIVGLFEVFSGSLREGVQTLQAVAPLLETKHDFVGSAFALMAIGVGLARLGRFEEAEQASQRSIEVAKDGDVIARIDALIGQASIRAARGDLEEAVLGAQQCTQLAVDSGATACVVASSFVAGDALTRMRRYADAKPILERSNSIAHLTNERMFRPVVNAYLHSIAANLGEYSIGARSIDEALADTRELHDRWGEANVLWRRADAALQNPDGDRQQMLADYEAAANLFHAMGARPYEARALREWGEALRSLERPEDGNAKLTAALAMFDELGLAREADEVRSILT